MVLFNECDVDRIFKSVNRFTANLLYFKFGHFLCPLAHLSVIIEYFKSASTGLARANFAHRAATTPSTHSHKFLEKSAKF